jgi:hypothetical protein
MVIDRSQRWNLVSALVGASAAISVVLLARAEGLPDLETLAIFVGLMVFSEFKAVYIGGVAISPGWMIGVASIVAFGAQGSLLGPLCVGMAAGIDVTDVRRRAWSLVSFNVGMIGLATLAGAFGYSRLPSDMTSHFPVAFVAAIVATACYLAVFWPIMILGAVAKYGGSVRTVVASIAPAIAQTVSFSLVGFLLGLLYVALGWTVTLLIVVPILIAREMFASYIRVKEAHAETVQMLIRALEQKDRYTAGHAERVANYARYIGEELNFMPARLERLQFAALMHDIGKLVVPNYILNKPGRLTPDEFDQIRMHEKIGVQMLSHIDFLRPIAANTHGDNMRFNPDDPDHPIEPYIVMIADAYDAMTSTRAYRKALSQDVAFQELRDKSGIQFHPRCVEALIHAIETKGERHGAGFEERAEFVDAPDVGLGSAGLGDLLPSETP